jgi:hypothetical protein
MTTGARNSSASRGGEAEISFDPTYGIARYRPGEDPDDDATGVHGILDNFWCWRDFVEWVDSLPAEAYPTLVRFGRECEVTDTQALAAQLKRAFKSHRPTSQWATRVARKLLRFIGKGNAAEFVTLKL